MTHILLVEDNEEVRRLLAEILEEAGYKVSTAADFDRAKEAISNERPDLLVTDIVLPGGGSGRELVDFARGRGIKCMLVTGHPEWMDKMPQDVPSLIKPFRPAALIQEVGRLARP